MRWRQFSCSAICYWLSSLAISRLFFFFFLANTTTDHSQLQSVLEKYFQSIALSHCKSPQVHSSHLWKWGLFFLAHQHLTETDRHTKCEVQAYFRTTSATVTWNFLKIVSHHPLDNHKYFTSLISMHTFQLRCVFLQTLPYVAACLSFTLNTWMQYFPSSWYSNYSPNIFQSLGIMNYSAMNIFCYLIFFFCRITSLGETESRSLRNFIA